MKNIYKIIFLLILQSSIFNFQSVSQTAPGIQWQNTIGGLNNDYLHSVQQTSDGGYILGGYSYSNISGDKTENNNGLSDYWIVKLNASGNIQWQNTIGGNNWEALYSLQQTADGGYILGGWSESGISGDKTEQTWGYADYWMVKTNTSGNIQWQNTIGGFSDDFLSSIRQTADGGYILAGYSGSPVSGDKTENSIGASDYWIVKTNVSGIIQWQNTIGGIHLDELYSARQTTDGGYILAGRSQSDISGDKTENCLGDWDYWIVKTDATGNIQWQNTIGGSLIDEMYSVKQTVDGGYILGGSSRSHISGDKTEDTNGWLDYWLLKTDATGNIQWQNSIGGGFDDELYSIQQTADGGYILGGSSVSDISGDKTENSIGGTDYWIVKTDAIGNILWQNTIGGLSFDVLQSVYQTADGGYILGGYSESDISGDKTEDSNGDNDYWIVKLFPDTITGISNRKSEIQNPQFFPNPLASFSTLTFSNPQKIKFTFSLYDITGRVVGTVSTASDKIVLEKGNKQAGVYFFRLENVRTGQCSNGKIVISD
ncbi:MAG: T9SS type A sorting domain-containing protein [Bacteroidia bacterium]